MIEPNFSEMYNERMRGSDHKFQQGKLQLDNEKKNKHYDGV